MPRVKLFPFKLHECPLGQTLGPHLGVSVPCLSPTEYSTLFLIQAGKNSGFSKKCKFTYSGVVMVSRQVKVAVPASHIRALDRELWLLCL